MERITADEVAQIAAEMLGGGARAT